MVNGKQLHNDIAPVESTQASKENSKEITVTSVIGRDSIHFKFKPLSKHPQEDSEFLLCVKCNLATCPGCD